MGERRKQADTCLSPGKEKKAPTNATASSLAPGASVSAGESGAV